MITIKSPGNLLEASLSVTDLYGYKQCLAYNLKYKGQVIIDWSGLGFTFKNMEMFKENLIIEKIYNRRSSRKTWIPVCGERSLVKDHYNEICVLITEKSSKRQVRLDIRLFDRGLAFRLTLEFPQHERAMIERELTEFRFMENCYVWATYFAEGLYTKVRISDMKDMCESPLVVEPVSNGPYLTVGEACMVDYASMKLSPCGERCIITDLSGVARYTVPKGDYEPDEILRERSMCKIDLPLPLTTPWRLIMAADTPGKLLENNDIYLNLNEPCAIQDTSYIKPGKAIRDVTLTTTGAKAYIDFAVKHNIQYIMFDAGWYGKEYSVESDATRVSIDPNKYAGLLDLKEAIKYGEEHGVGIILYVNGVALERQLDEILPVYKSWGVKGIKFGFVNVGPQSCSSWLHEAIRKAAQYGFVLAIHDEYRPTGYSRTYPNILTVEGVCGDEVIQSASNTLATIFTRMLCGHADNTVCYYAPRVDEKWSHAYQLAKALVIFSPLLFLYWYDRPLLPNVSLSEGNYYILGKEPELEFFDVLPTTWDDTRVLDGEIGSYIIMARRKGREWYVGTMNASIARNFDLSLDFLEKGIAYKAYIYVDDPAVQTRTHVGIKKYNVCSKTVFSMEIEADRGMAVRILPVYDIKSNCPEMSVKLISR